MENAIYALPNVQRHQEHFSNKVERRKLKFKKGTLAIADISQIIRLEGDSNYTWVYVQGRPRLLISKTLKKLEAQLPEFIRVHKGHLINPAFIATSIAQANSGYVTLSNGDLVPWSRAKLRNYKRKLAV